MGQQISVIEDGVAPERPSDRPKSSKVVVGVAFLVGIGVGALMASSGAPDTPGDVSESSDSPVLDAPGPVAEVGDGDPIEARGVSEIIPDFPDAIVAVAGTPGSTSDYLLWPIAGALSIRPMASGGEVIVDATAQFFALAGDMPNKDRSFLSMGRHNAIRPVASDVTSFAFHDTATGLLAYTTEEDGVTHLVTIKSDFDPREAATLPEPDVTIVGWGDWGWALQRGSNEIVLLTADGELKDTEPGVALDTHPSAWLVAKDGRELKLVSAGGGVRQLGDQGSLGTIQSATFAPDGMKVALDGERGLGVLDIESNELVELTDFSTGTTDWSSDSRFVLAATGSGVLVFDMETATMTRLLRQYSVMTVGSLPLSSS